MVIIYANLVVLLFRLIHIMFQGNRHSSSGEDCFTIWRPSWSYDLDQMYELSSSLWQSFENIDRQQTRALSLA